MKVNVGVIPVVSAGRSTAPSRGLVVSAAEEERACWYPKDGELCLSRLKPEETLVEGRSDSDVQIDRRTNHLVAGSLRSFPQDSWHSCSSIIR